MNVILGKKVKMSQIWKGEVVVPVTIIEAKPNTVAILRTKERDGYEAVQLKLGRTAKEFKNRKTVPVSLGEAKVGDSVTVAEFAEGDVIRTTAWSKGRGFQGVVKRHNFAGGPKTHGQKNRHRAPGSIGSTAFQRVLPGRRMAGHMMSEQVTQKNLKIVQIDTEKNLIFIKGAIPGAPGSVVEIIKTGTKK